MKDELTLTTVRKTKNLEKIKHFIFIMKNNV